jgi:small subunit ribosomal protein S6
LATYDYELILMLDPQAGDEQREKVASDAKSRLESKGEIKHEANWGMRKMAYEIDRRAEADYRVWRFTGGKDLLDDLDHSLKITDGVLRFRIFKVEADSPNIVPPDTEQVMRRDEDDRGRGRGDRGDRGPRRSRPDSPPAAERSEDEERSPEVAPASAAGTAEAGS